MKKTTQILMILLLSSELSWFDVVQVICGYHEVMEKLEWLHNIF